MPVIVFRYWQKTVDRDRKEMTRSATRTTHAERSAQAPGEEREKRLRMDSFPGLSYVSKLGSILADRSLEALADVGAGSSPPASRRLCRGGACPRPPVIP